MQIPALFYGTYSEVKSRCKRLQRTHLKGRGSLIELVESQGMLSTAEHEGDIVLDGPNPLLSHGADFHCFALLRVYDVALSASLREAESSSQAAVPGALLERCWGILCLLDGNNMSWWVGPDRAEYWRRFLRAALGYWDELVAEEPRYANSAYRDQSVWQAGFPLRRALGAVGVGTDVLVAYRDGIPHNDLAAFVLAHADPALAQDVQELARSLLGRPRRAPAPRPPDRPPIPESEPGPDYVTHEASPAMEAALQGDDETAVQRLIEAGEPVDAFAVSVLTVPLLWAAERGQTELLRYLLARGARANARGIEGETALMLAAREGNLEAVQLLLAHGADPNAVTPNGWSALAWAAAKGHAEVLALLEAVYSPEQLEANHEECE